MFAMKDLKLPFQQPNLSCPSLLDHCCVYQLQFDRLLQLPDRSSKQKVLATAKQVTTDQSELSLRPLSGFLLCNSRHNTSSLRASLGYLLLCNSSVGYKTSSSQELITTQVLLCFILFLSLIFLVRSIAISPSRIWFFLQNPQIFMLTYLKLCFCHPLELCMVLCNLFWSNNEEFVEHYINNADCLTLVVRKQKIVCWYLIIAIAYGYHSHSICVIIIDIQPVTIEMSKYFENHNKLCNKPASKLL